MSQFGRKNETPEQKEARIAKLRATRPLKSSTEKRAIEEISDLPRWAKVGIARHEVLGESWEDAGKSVKRSAKSLSDYGNSPAGKKWREQLRKVADDPKVLSEALLKGSVPSITLDYLLAYQRAIDANDYKETGVIARDLLDRFGLTKKEAKQAALPSQIIINMPGGTSLEIPVVQSEHKALTGEVIIDAELVEDNG